eukprot:m.187681 g.187681  ORF g.187681 m.187681 type:complete len:97 (+) comp15071_c0_seq22:1153-1443(+)
MSRCCRLPTPATPSRKIFISATGVSASAFMWYTCPSRVAMTISPPLQRSTREQHQDGEFEWADKGFKRIEGCRKPTETLLVGGETTLGQQALCVPS